MNTRRQEIQDRKKATKDRRYQAGKRVEAGVWVRFVEGPVTLVGKIGLVLEPRTTDQWERKRAARNRHWAVRVPNECGGDPYYEDPEFSIRVLPAKYMDVISAMEVIAEAAK